MSSTEMTRYTRNEEIANVATHGAGFLLSIVALVVMVRYAVSNGDSWRVFSASVFGATLISAYLASTLYHLFTRPRLKQAFRLFDHASIFLLIAGSYTPFTLVLMREGWGWPLFAIVWSLAACGITFKLLSSSRFRDTAVPLYIGMGWMALIAIKPLFEAMPPGCFAWVALGGVTYTSGVAFYLWQKLPYNHAIWHVFVMAGSFFHFVAVYWYVLPMQSTVVA